jgi:hypothetical protein
MVRGYVGKRTDHAIAGAYNQYSARNAPNHARFTWGNEMTNNLSCRGKLLFAATVVLMAGCSSLKTPATADVAVSKAAVENAAGAGGAEFAPIEMKSAREKMVLANQAMAVKDYKLAMDLADQAQVDASLAQGKANSARAQMASDALQDDIRVLRAELERANRQIIQ